MWTSAIERMRRPMSMATYLTILLHYYPLLLLGVPASCRNFLFLHATACGHQRRSS